MFSFLLRDQVTLCYKRFLLCHVVSEVAIVPGWIIPTFNGFSFFNLFPFLGIFHVLEFSFHIAVFLFELVAFLYFCRQCFKSKMLFSIHYIQYLRKRQHAPCFYGDRYSSGISGERKMLWEHEPQVSVSSAFRSSPKVSQVFL